MGEFLLQEELTRLEHGLPKMSECGEHVLVPFKVCELKRARVVWVNRRWFLERGFDLADDASLDRISSWLISEFGYVSPSLEDKKSAFTGRTKVAYADRYGSSGGLAPHGGSGRAAVYGCFQAKGVGITPLVGVDATADHSNGCASLAEGIREAIYAEIVAAEFPHGAVPIIALIDTGLHYSAPGPNGTGNQKIRRAIIVRPNAFRPAHAERAALFKQSITGYTNSQASDVRRARDFVQYWSQGEGGAEQLPGLRETIGRVAEQAAFGLVHRLFCGGYFSSNLSVTGELLDFGNMHVLPDWQNAKVLAHTSGFGKELEAIDVLTKSMNFHFKKYADPASYQDSAESMRAYANERFQSAFSTECLRLFQSEDLAGSTAGDGIIELLTRYLSEQQRAWRRYQQGQIVDRSSSSAGNEWLYPALVPDAGALGVADASTAGRLVEAIARHLRRAFEDLPEGQRRGWLSWMTALRMLRPREEIDRGLVLQRIQNLISNLNFAEQGAAAQVSKLIADMIHIGRVNWSRLPSGLAVLAKATQDGCTALLCGEGPGMEQQIWLEAIWLEDRFCLFGEWIPINEVREYGLKMHDTYLTLLVPGRLACEQDRLLLCMGRHEIRIPRMSNCVPPDLVPQLGPFVVGPT